MLENNGSILEILAALYITLAFDEVLNHFVQRFDVRTKLTNTILQNLRDSDRQVNETKEFVDNLCDDFIKVYSRFAPVFLFLSLTLLFIISCGEDIGKNVGCSEQLTTKTNYILVIGTKLAVAGFVIFLVFLYKRKWFGHKTIVTIIFLMSIATLFMALYPEECFIERYIGINYISSKQQILVSIIILLILSLPIIYMIFYSWAYPASCNVLLENRNIYKNYLNNNIRSKMDNETDYGYYNTFVFLPIKLNDNSLEKYEQLLKNKSIINLYNCSREYKKKLENVKRVIQDVQELQ